MVTKNNAVEESNNVVVVKRLITDYYMSGRGHRKSYKSSILNLGLTYLDELDIHTINTFRRIFANYSHQLKAIDDRLYKSEIIVDKMIQEIAKAKSLRRRIGIFEMCSEWGYGVYAVDAADTIIDLGFDMNYERLTFLNFINNFDNTCHVLCDNSNCSENILNSIAYKMGEVCVKIDRLQTA